MTYFRLTTQSISPYGEIVAPLVQAGARPVPVDGATSRRGCFFYDPTCNWRLAARCSKASQSCPCEEKSELSESRGLNDKQSARKRNGFEAINRSRNRRLLVSVKFR